MENARVIGKRIEALIDERDVSERMLAVSLGMSIYDVRCGLMGLKYFSFDTLTRISILLNVPLEDIVKESENVTDESEKVLDLIEDYIDLKNVVQEEVAEDKGG